MDSDNEFVPRSQKLVNQIAGNVEIGQKSASRKNADFWKTVLFSDEIMVELKNDKLHRFRRPKTRFEPQFLAKFNGFLRKKLMIWGCIRSNGDRLLIPIESKVDSDAYTKILTDQVIEFFFMHEPFQQDNAPAHTSLKTRIFWENGFTLLEKWPLNLLIIMLLKIHGAS